MSTIAQVRETKRELEDGIRALIAAFEDATGVCVESVDVRRVSTTTLDGGRVSTSILAGVCVELEPL
jgi:hypothetical protein